MEESGKIQLKSEGYHEDPAHLTSSIAVDIPSKMYSTDSDLSDWETRQFGRHRITSPPLIHKNQPSDDDNHVPPGSPGKRSYEKTFDAISFEATAENVQLSPNKKKHKEQVWTPGKENQGRMPKNWNNSVSSRDSALGSSLFSAFGSVLTDSSTSFESQSNSDDTTSSVNSSPVHSVYGRYQKIYTNDKEKNNDNKALREYENLLLHRLPGENLGMILGIEGGKFNSTISGVFVKTVTIGGAAYRATGSTKGIAVGDEILEVNGMDLKEMNREECMTVLKEMPLRVNLMVRRGSKFSGPTTPDGVSHFRQKMKEVSSREMKVCKGQRFMQNYAMTTTTSESEDDLLEGFALRKVEVDKNPDESLGISIVPSYGSTREFYQIKRLLPSGAAARSTKLRVGDRLVSCNGASLRNLAQAKCLSILKTEAQRGDLELEVLRQAENDNPMEISVIVANGVGSKESEVSSSNEQEIYPNSGLESESDNDVVLSGFHFNREKSHPDSVSQVFAQNAKLQNRAPTKHPPKRNNSESNVSDQDSDYSLKSQHQKLVKAKMASNSSDPWSLALPPPAEFSDDAGLTSEAGDTGDEQVPTTNIDDILSDYAPSISGPSSPRLDSVKKDLQSGDVSSGLDRSQEGKRVNSLTQIQECPQELESDLSIQNGIDDQKLKVNNQTNGDNLQVPNKSMNNYGYDTLREQRQVMDVFDSYLTSEDDSIVSNHQNNDTKSPSHSSVDVQDSSQSKQRNILSKQVDWQPHNNMDEVTDVNPEDIKFGHKNVVTEVSDDEPIVPVQLKREMSTPPDWSKYSLSSDIPASVFDLPGSSVDEDVIIPASIHREKKTSVHKSPTPHLDVSPPRAKLPPKRPKPQPRKSKSSESEESVEEVVSPIHVKKEKGSRVLEEKIGTDIEETLIVPEKSKRENSWSGVQLVVMANKWAAKSPNSSDRSGGGLFNVISNLKSDKTDNSAPEVSGVTVQSITPMDNKQKSSAKVTPVNNVQGSKPGDNIVNISLETAQDYHSSEENSSEKEHLITPRIEDFGDENEDEKVSITVVHNADLSESSQTDVNQPTTHKTILCVSDNVTDSDPNLPVAYENAVTLENDVLIDTDISGGQPLISSSVSESSPVLSQSDSLRSPVMKSHDTLPSPVPRSPEARSPVPRSPEAKSPVQRSPEARSPVARSPEARSPVPRSPEAKSPVSGSPEARLPVPRSPEARSPVPRSRKDVSPGRKSPSPSPRAVSSGVTMSVDPVKELSTTKISVVSPRSVSVPSPTTTTEGEEKVQAVRKQDSPTEPAPKPPTKYTTSVAVTKPSLLSTIRSQKTTTSGNLKPLSTIKPLKINTSFQPKPIKYSTTINTKPSLLSTLHGSALSTTSTAEAKSSRSEDEPFQVNVLKGILGLGMKVKVTPEGHTQVTEVQSTGPIAKDKNIRAGDYILAINNTELTGLHDSKVQQILRLLPRGLAKIIASATPPSGDSGEPRGNSNEASSRPKVLDADMKKSTQQLSPKVSPTPQVNPSGPKVTPTTVVAPSEPTKYISSPGNPVTDTVVPTVRNKLQNTIITNNHQQQMTKPDISMPAPRDEIPKPTPRDDLPKPAPRDVVPKPAPREIKTVSEPAVRKELPPIAPKPKLDKSSKPEPMAASRASMGGYVGSAAGKVRSYEKPSVTDVGSSYSTPSCSAKKSATSTDTTKTEIDSTGPIDTVIFTSIGGPKKSPPKSGQDDQEPRLIPSGHVDYVSSAKPRSQQNPSSPRQDLPGPMSPKLPSPSAKDTMKISPRKVNSALSPRKSKDHSHFNLFSTSSQITAPVKKLPAENATGFLRPTLPKQPGKSDETHSDTNAPDIDVVTPQNAHNVESSPAVNVEADIISVVDKPHVDVQNVESESNVSVVDMLHASAQSLPIVDKQDSDGDNQIVQDQISQEVICAVSHMPESEDGDEGKVWPALDASVEVLHEDDATKPFLSGHNLPNNMKDDICVGEEPTSEADSEEYAPPLPPQSTMPVALGIAKDMLDDILNDVGEEPSPQLPSVPSTIAREMLRDQEYDIQLSEDSTEDSSEDKPFFLPSIPPSLPPSIPPPLPSTIPPMNLDELTESPVDDIVGVIPNNDRANFGVVIEDGISIGDQAALMDLPDDFNTNASLSVRDGASPVHCMSESNDLLCSVNPSQDACPNVVIDSQPQIQGGMFTDSYNLDTGNSTYDSVFFQQDSPGSQGHPGDLNDLEKSSNHFSGNSLNSVEDFVDNGVNPVYKEPVNVYNPENTLDSADIALCIDNAENQRRGDNSPFHDNSGEPCSSCDQSNFLPQNYQSRSGTHNPDIKSPNRGFSDNDSSMIKSRRRWSVMTGPQELNVANVNGSVSSDLTLDESIMSSENLAILLESANDVMDQTGLSLDDEIVVIILHRIDLAMPIGVRLTVGPHQEAVVLSVDSDSLAGKDGRIAPGDVLLSVNGDSLMADKTEEVMDNLNKTISSHVVLVVSKSDLLDPSMSVDTDNPDGSVVDVTKTPSSPSEITTSPPEVTTSPPEINTSPPQINTSPPEITNTPPEITTSPPEVTASPPEINTSPPEITNTPAEIKTSPPEITTSPPQINTSPPEITNTPPEINTSPPEITTSPAQITTTPPEITTTPPEINTSPQEITTSPPQINTSPPEITNTPPEINTSPPEITTSPAQITTTPPEITTTPPEINTSPQEIATSPPQITTTPPEVTTALPEVNNTPPKVNTIPPEINTSPPEIATSPPQITTTPPEVTTTPPEITNPPPEVPTMPPEVPTTPPEISADVAKRSGVKEIKYEMPVFDEPVDDKDKEEFDVVMTKGVTGLGFLIEGGKASPRGDVPLIIRRILKNGPADKCGQLKVKDEIREVNGEDLTDMRHSEAWQHLKFLDDGEVRLKIWRKKVQQ